MAFKLPYPVTCDGDHCIDKRIIYARTEEEANAELEKQNWSVKRYPTGTKHYCAKCKHAEN